MKQNALEPPRAEASVGERRVGRWLPFALPLLLTGCPLSDKYYVDLDSGGGSSAGGQNGGTASFASGGKITSSGGDGTSDTCGSSACAKDCCDGACVSLANDPSNCGSCGNVCSAGRSCDNGSCSGGWVSMAPPPAGFEARQRSASVAFNGKLFVFGGVNSDGDELNSAAIYDPMSDSWTLAAVDGSTPSARQWATALALSDRVLVLGGRADGTTYLKSVASYEPTQDRWHSRANADSTRAASIAGLAGNYVVVAGGLTTAGAPAPGADIYDIANDKWHVANAMGAPPAVLGGGWAFDAGNLFVFGGLNNQMRIDRGFRYDVAKDMWEPLPPGGPSARSGAFAAFDDQHYFVWGGRDENALHDDGALFNLKMWSKVATDGAPSPRTLVPRQAGWAFALGSDDFVVLGGETLDGSALTNGGRLQGGTWRSIPSWPSGEAHSGAAVALVGREIVVWGGSSGDRLTTTGERWLAQ